MTIVHLNFFFTVEGGPEIGGPGGSKSQYKMLGDIARFAAYASVGLALSLIVRELNNGSSFRFSGRTNDDKKNTTKESNINIDILEPQGVVTERVYFDVSICGGPPERLVVNQILDCKLEGNLHSYRLVIGLYGDDCPLTVTNFSRLCDGIEEYEYNIGNNIL